MYLNNNNWLNWGKASQAETPVQQQYIQPLSSFDKRNSQTLPKADALTILKQRLGPLILSIVPDVVFSSLVSVIAAAFGRLVLRCQ